MPGPGQSVGREKVFCKRCHWLEDAPTLVNIKCAHPNNRNRRKDNWYTQAGPGQRPPWKINKKNKCGWYDPKGSLLRSGGGKKLL